MPIELMVADKVRILPPNHQQEVLDFVEFLYQKWSGERQVVRKSLISPFGMWSGIHITDKEIEDARYEMWGNVGQEIDL